MLKILFMAALLMMQVPEAFRPANDLFRVNGGKPLLDAHNCYPYDGKWRDRIDRALSTGFPVAIEQDIAPFLDPSTGKVTPRVTHRSVASAADPTLKQHFFERVRPIVEKALREGKTDTWPLIVLHFDFKDNSAPTLQAVWDELAEYESWITTAPKSADDRQLAPLDWKPLLVLTEDNDNQEQVFYRNLPEGAKLRLFGSAQTNPNLLKGLNEKQRAYALAHAAPDTLLKSRSTNYRRWWNNSWAEVEEGGAPAAGDWSRDDNIRLQRLVDHAHRLGYWIRFYTLDGFAPGASLGWDRSYNFGSLSAVQSRWRACLKDGVDLVATDQYEQLQRFVSSQTTSGQ